jgi:excisionase family DNA binding protein
MPVIFDERALRQLLREEVDQAVRRAMATGGPTSSGDYISVAEAARIASVTRSTIRAWINEGRLGRYGAGPRVLRVKRAELELLLSAASNTKDPPSGDLSPEAEAARFLRRRAQDVTSNAPKLRESRSPKRHTGGKGSEDPGLG